jgi:hypothetical protein
MLFVKDPQLEKMKDQLKNHVLVSLLPVIVSRCIEKSGAGITGVSSCRTGVPREDCG